MKVIVEVYWETCSIRPSAHRIVTEPSWTSAVGKRMNLLVPILLNID